MSYYRNAKRAFAMVGTLILGVVLMAFSTSISPASSDQRSDVASTYKYLQAAYVELYDSSVHLSVTRNELRIFAAEVDKHCPNVLVGVRSDRYTLGFESGLAFIVVVKIEKSIMSIEQNFIHDVRVLAVSDPHLRRAIDGFEREVVRQLIIRTPDLCSEADAWLRAGLYALPKNMARFTKESEAVPSMPSLLLTLPMQSKQQREIDLIGKIRRILPRFSRLLATLIVASRAELLHILGIRNIAGRPMDRIVTLENGRFTETLSQPTNELIAENSVSPWLSLADATRKRVEVTGRTSAPTPFASLSSLRRPLFRAPAQVG